jgi:hypothetical protein
MAFEYWLPPVALALQITSHVLFCRGIAKGGQLFGNAKKASPLGKENITRMVGTYAGFGLPPAYSLKKPPAATGVKGV